MINSVVIYKMDTAGSFGYPHHQDGVRDYVHVRHGVRVAEAGFRSD